MPTVTRIIGAPDLRSQPTTIRPIRQRVSDKTISGKLSIILRMNLAPLAPEYQGEGSLVCVKSPCA